MSAQSDGDEKGIVTKASPYPSLSETLDRLRETVGQKGLDVFALIDHSGAAKQVGLEMQEAKLLVFGSPKAGTPLMVATPLLALDLPLKVLIWRAGDGGEVLVSYNATPYLARRHDIPQDLVGNIAGIDALVGAALGGPEIPCRVTIAREGLRSASTGSSGRNVCAGFGGTCRTWRPTYAKWTSTSASSTRTCATKRRRARGGTGSGTTRPRISVSLAGEQRRLRTWPSGPRIVPLHEQATHHLPRGAHARGHGRTQLRALGAPARNLPGSRYAGGYTNDGHPTDVKTVAPRWKNDAASTTIRMSPRNGFGQTARGDGRAFLDGFGGCTADFAGVGSSSA